jgi:hypothetical protein
MVEVRIAAELSETFPHSGPVCVTKAMSYLAVGQTTEITPAHYEQVAGKTVAARARQCRGRQLQLPRKGGMHFAQVGTICGGLPCFLRRTHGSCVGTQDLCDGCKAIAYGLAVVHDKVDEVVETR